MVGTYKTAPSRCHVQDLSKQMNKRNVKSRRPPLLASPEKCREDVPKKNSII